MGNDDPNTAAIVAAIRGLQSAVEAESERVAAAVQETGERVQTESILRAIERIEREVGSLGESVRVDMAEVGERVDTKGVLTGLESVRNAVRQTEDDLRKVVVEGNACTEERLRKVVVDGMACTEDRLRKVIVETNGCTKGELGAALRREGASSNGLATFYFELGLGFVVLTVAIALALVPGSADFGFPSWLSGFLALTTGATGLLVILKASGKYKQKRIGRCMLFVSLILPLIFLLGVFGYEQFSGNAAHYWFRLGGYIWYLVGAVWCVRAVGKVGGQQE